MVAGQRLLRQLRELDGVLDLLERMNIHHQTEVSAKLTDLIEALGMNWLSPSLTTPKWFKPTRQLRGWLG